MFSCDNHTLVTETKKASDIPECILSSKTKFSLKNPMFLLTNTDNMTIFQDKVVLCHYWKQNPVCRSTSNNHHKLSKIWSKICRLLQISLFHRTKSTLSCEFLVNLMFSEQISFNACQVRNLCDTSMQNCYEKFDWYLMEWK